MTCDKDFRSLWWLPFASKWMKFPFIHNMFFARRGSVNTASTTIAASVSYANTINTINVEDQNTFAINVIITLILHSLFSPKKPLSPLTSIERLKVHDYQELNNHGHNNTAKVTPAAHSVEKREMYSYSWKILRENRHSVTLIQT